MGMSKWKDSNGNIYQVQCVSLEWDRESYRWGLDGNFSVAYTQNKL